MDLDDLLEDLWEDSIESARRRAGKARAEFDRRRRLPGFRSRLHTATLWASATWAGTFGGLGVGSVLLLEGAPEAIFALLFGGLAVPAVGTGYWAWRARRNEGPAERQAMATSAAKKERAELPADVRGDWVRLRRAQALVADLATEGLVEPTAVAETATMVDELRALLVADRRAAELGADGSVPLRDQVGEVADLLVALAAEAVDHRTAQVGAAGAPATLRDGRDRLVSLRAARSEVDQAADGAAAASAFIERELHRHAPPDPPAPRPRRQDTDGDDERGTPMPG